MSDIELVIKIPERIHYGIEKGITVNGSKASQILIDAVAKGTPLPKGHGRLMVLSEDAVKREQTPLSFSCQNWISEVGLSNATVAIIEADRSEDKE